MKIIGMFLIGLLLPLLTSAQINLKLKITNAEKNGGKIYIALFNSESSYKARQVYKSFVLNADDMVVTKNLTLPGGQYVFSIYQDQNGNGKLDTNLVGIPREKFGFTNYDGKGAPGNFSRHKIELKATSNEIELRLHKI